MAPLPVIKLAAVLLKEVSKPLAAEIKRRAQEHAAAKRVAIVMGRWWEGMSQRAEIFVRGHRVKELKPINDAHALTVGADLISQSFLLSTAIGLIMLEYWRSSSASAKAAEVQREEKAVRRAAKEVRLAAIEAALARLEGDVRRLEQAAAGGVLGGAAAWLPRLGRGASSAAAPSAPLAAAGSGAEAAASPSVSGGAHEQPGGVAVAAELSPRSRIDQREQQHVAGGLAAPSAEAAMGDGEAAYAAAAAAAAATAVTDSGTALSRPAERKPASWWASWWGWGAAAAPAQSALPARLAEPLRAEPLR